MTFDATLTINDQRGELTLSGELDSEAVPFLMNKVALLDEIDEDLKYFIIDMSNLTYITDAGRRAIISVIQNKKLRNLKRNVIFLGMQEEVEEQLSSTGFLNTFDFQYDRYAITEEITRQETADTTLVNKVQLPQPLVRYPNLDCPEKAILNQRFSLTLELLLEQPEDQLNLQAMEIPDPGTDELPEVELVLSASGFDIEGSNTQILEVERDDDSSTRFVLIPRKVGQHRIKVDFWQQGRRIGTARRNILVSEVPTSASVEQPNERLLLELKTTITVPPQDLDLLVDVLEDGRTLSFRLNSSKPEVNYNHKRVGQTTLQGSPLDKMQGVYKEMTNMAKKVPTTPEDRELAERRLTAIGNQLWDELVSDSLKQEYWRFKSRVKSLLITSEEPWIPWEMIKPYRYNDDGDVEQEPFWCQQFALSRWLAAGGTADEMIMGKARSIAPTPTNLPSVQAELAFIEQLPTLRPGITPLSTFGTRLQVLDCFTNEEFSLLHFACHGTFDSTSPNNSAIKLADGELRPADIRVRFIGRRPRPLIFINACHGARSEYSFTGLGGWATILVDAHVGAFIGAMWEVSDRLALQFAKTFYTQLLQENQSIAESFRVAREEIRKAAPYNSTWLAYSLYADPEGRVKVLSK